MTTKLFILDHDARLIPRAKELIRKGVLFTGLSRNGTDFILSAPRYSDITVPADLAHRIRAVEPVPTSFSEIRKLTGADDVHTRYRFGKTASYQDESRPLNADFYIHNGGGYHYRANGLTVDNDETLKFAYNNAESETGWLRNTNLTSNTSDIKYLRPSTHELLSNTLTGTNHMPDLNSPNKDKSFRNVKVVNLSDAALIEQIVQLNGFKTTVEAGVLTEEQVLKFGGISKKDYADGLTLLKSELTFRENREALAELARIDAELESLKTREQKQRDAEAKKAELLAKIPQNLRPTE